MKRVLLGLFLVTIALIGICSVSAADADSVVVDNSHVALGDAPSIVSDFHVDSSYRPQIGDSYLNWHHGRDPRGFVPVGLDDCNERPPAQIGDGLFGGHHDRNPRGFVPVGLDDCNGCPCSQIGDGLLGWHHDRNPRG